MNDYSFTASAQHSRKWILLSFCTITTLRTNCLAALLYLRLGQKLLVVFSQSHFNQTPKFSSSVLSILHCTENGKLGDENLGVFSEVYPLKDLGGVILTPSGFFWITQKRVELFQRNFSYSWSITKDVCPYKSFLSMSLYFGREGP